MSGLPGQDMHTMVDTLTRITELGPEHISIYSLQVEEGTQLSKRPDLLNMLPDEDTDRSMYHMTKKVLRAAGYERYEISNYAKPGYESRHNLKYWNCEEYLGIGAAAHSFIDGKRFYYPRSAEGFINGISPEADGEGGDFGEYAMLRLRLTDGLDEGELEKKFGISIPDNMRKKAEKYAADGYLVSDGQGIRLTRKGFLVSNTIISELIY